MAMSDIMQLAGELYVEAEAKQSPDALELKLLQEIYNRAAKGVMFGYDKVSAQAA